ncbi:hypothetical protein [Amycolatopsis vancoresmycina]|uniref:Uncharacterized protein n=1 Tax=Amycolatopsis vancoresmycina DSM 44592 TaxID=1292037 RepID=R1FVZ2_9PSEU|nr:hypothetical protein [Amycolatopsis vancoresmycina]EOD63507.1 hypothetical protein H480_36623 [Amycolatopsis vancoresmycina DSM 44592]
MPELGIDTIAFAAARREEYVPLSALPGAADLVPPERLAAAGIPLSRLMVRIPEDDDVDVAAEVLAALGPPALPQPLFFVRSGPLRDPNVAALAGLVHRSGWAGDDVGLSHLDELGGTAVFGLLEWAVETEATAIVCDEPLFADSDGGHPRFAAVGLRVRRGAAALTVSGCGEGKPALPGDHRFTGRGPCDAWLAFCAALAEGVVADGDRVLLHTRGPIREGWLSLLAVDVSALRLVPAATASLLGGRSG